MQPDDDICLCFHVTLRKLMNFAERTQPRHTSQMSDCLGAGTGCGWCIPTLAEIADAARNKREPQLPKSPAEYAAQRRTYRARKSAESGGGAAESPA